jgi:hypothetical protein
MATAAEDSRALKSTAATVERITALKSLETTTRQEDA